MKSNVGGIDRVLRLSIGLVLVALTLAGIVGPFGWLGLVLVATAALRFCPLYPLLGINTCPTSR